MMTTADKVVGGTALGSAYVADRGLGSSPCDIPNWTEMPLFYVNQYAFTVDNLFRTLAAIATVVTIIYFISKFRSK